MPFGSTPQKALLHEGREFLPAYPYIDGASRRTMMRYTRPPHENEAGYNPRSRSTTRDLNIPYPEASDYRKILTYGSGRRHRVFTMGFGSDSVRLGPNRESQAFFILNLLGRTDGEISDVITGTKSINSFMVSEMFGHKPLSQTSKIIVVYNQGLTVNGNPKIYEGIFEFKEFDNSGEYFLSENPVILVEHGAWQHGGHYRTIDPRFRCHRVALYRDCYFDQEQIVLGQLKYVMRPKPTELGSEERQKAKSIGPEFEPFSLYFNDYTDYVLESSFPPPIEWEPAKCENFDNIDGGYGPAIMNGIAAHTYTPPGTGGFPIQDRLLSIYSDDDVNSEAVGIADAIEIMCGFDNNEGTRFDLIVEMNAYQYVVKRAEVVIRPSGAWRYSGYEIEEMGYLGQCGRVYFCV